MKDTLKDLCINCIINHHSLFKTQMASIPAELQEDIRKELPENKMQCIGGKWYAKTTNPISGDWLTYKL